MQKSFSIFFIFSKALTRQGHDNKLWITYTYYESRGSRWILLICKTNRWVHLRTWQPVFRYYLPCFDYKLLIFTGKEGIVA